MAFKVFSNGSTLPASDLNDYLMRQSVMVFSNSTARASAIISPNEGMLTWLEDVNKYQYYSGSAWVDLGDQPAGWSDKSANYSIVAADLGTTIRSTGSAITITIDNVLTQQGDQNRLYPGRSRSDYIRSWSWRYSIFSRRKAKDC
jgi:hypothetical protein